MASNELDEPLAQFRLALDAGGLTKALRYLNGHTSFRYTAIYRLDGQMLHNICIFDRQGKDCANLAEIPLGDSFCQIAMLNNGFSTGNSAEDARLVGHPSQGVLNSYFGLPLSRKPGTIYGTFCHLDPEPRVIPDSEVALLEAATAVLMDYLEQPVVG
jgi:GAF domain-containing protein